jgi:hypothetical protein
MLTLTTKESETNDRPLRSLLVSNLSMLRILHGVIDGNEDEIIRAFDQGFDINLLSDVSLNLCSIAHLPFLGWMFISSLCMPEKRIQDCITVITKRGKSKYCKSGDKS